MHPSENSSSDYFEVALPDGRKPLVSRNPKNWPEVGKTDFVPLYAVLPDPEQPRNTEGITQTASHRLFSHSISNHGQGLIVQVRPLSREELKEERERNPLARYRLVDGERRFHAVSSAGAQQQVIEVTVHEYKDKRNLFLKQVVLNTMQEPLNTPDLARALKKLKDYFGLNASKLALQVNMGQGKVNDLLHLINLAPDLLELTNKEKYGRREGIAIKPAVALSKVVGDEEKSAHERQRELLQEARKRKIHGAVQQVAFFEAHHTVAVREHSEKRQPKRRRNRLETMLSFILCNDMLEASPDELRRILAPASNEEVTALLKKTKKARDSLGKLAENIEAIQQSPQEGAKDIEGPGVSVLGEKLEDKQPRRKDAKDIEGPDVSVLGDDSDDIPTVEEDPSEDSDASAVDKMLALGRRFGDEDATERSGPRPIATQRGRSRQRKGPSTPSTQNSLARMIKRGTVEGVSYSKENPETGEEERVKFATISLEKFIDISDAGRLRHQILIMQNCKKPEHIPSEARVREAIRARA